MLRIADLEIPGPVIVASGPLTSKVELLEQAQAAGATAAALKLTFVEVPFAGQMRSYSLPGQAIISPIDHRLDLEQGCRLARQAKQQTNLILLANLGARGDEPDNWRMLAERFAEAGVDGLELNFCCPNLDVDALRAAQGRGEHGGVQICDYPEQCYRITELVKRTVDLPLICKYMPNPSAGQQVARACAQAGADAIHIVGLPGTGLPPVDPDTGRPDMPLVEGISWGGSNGPICRYSTFMLVAQVARQMRIPIIASGGISDWRDVVSALMWGASGVGICTAIMWSGWRMLSELQEDLADYLRRRGHADWQQIRGRALQHLTTPDRMVLTDGASHVEPELCIGCGRCLLPGHCDAIEMVDGRAVVDPKRCIGCGICPRLCPTGAIELQPADPANQR